MHMVVVEMRSWQSSITVYNNIIYYDDDCSGTSFSREAFLSRSGSNIIIIIILLCYMHAVVYIYIVSICHMNVRLGLVWGRQSSSVKV